MESVGAVDDGSERPGFDEFDERQEVLPETSRIPGPVG
jgi:hypothetical protein